METWDEKKVLQWIQERNNNILKDNNLKNFKKAYMIGSAFLASDLNFFLKTCGLPSGVGLALLNLANRVIENGKFIPWT
jgi:hypothetical protein